MSQLPVNLFYKRAGTEARQPLPRFIAPLFIQNKVAAIHQFIPFQTPKAFGNTSFQDRPGRRGRWRFFEGVILSVFAKLARRQWIPVFRGIHQIIFVFIRLFSFLTAGRVAVR